MLYITKIKDHSDYDINYIVISYCPKCHNVIFVFLSEFFCLANYYVVYFFAGSFFFSWLLPFTLFPFFQNFVLLLKSALSYGVSILRQGTSLVQRSCDITRRTVEDYLCFSYSLASTFYYCFCCCICCYWLVSVVSGWHLK